MISGIILASGFSRRMERDKLLLDINGMAIIERVIKMVCKSDVDEVIMIYRKEEIREIAKRYGIKTVFNKKAKLGQSEAVKLGIVSSSKDVKGYMFFMGDQPFLKVEAINNIIKVFKSGKYQVVVPIFDGKRGNPVIFSRDLRQQLLNVSGDIGGRGIIQGLGDKVGFVYFNNRKIGMDIDTWEDYLNCREWS
ncbi:molybdenum cofactor cytidylyltransferase [Caloranaerobacter ferrireducens]|uniref:molybdenum cofactor cytidylyltransferase n=1 Tax=Caloranaerobacter ferrireducens TaxID=1323370 RepID=UPI00084CF5FE|nr:molybdenum cofactor cytidylyltransferase [Caloranaerobacter ferrireducens]